MSAYFKFLRPGRISPFARYPWPAPAEWIDAGKVDPCRSGIHACRTSDLPYWLDEELWEVELDGYMTETATKVIARRARLVRRIGVWNAATAHEFGVACVGRIATFAAAELRAVGLAEPAAELDGALAEGRAKSGAERAAELARAANRQMAEWLCGYVVYTTEALDKDPVASIAYIAARAARQRGDATDSDSERQWQARWLVERLGLRRRSPVSFLRRR